MKKMHDDDFLTPLKNRPGLKPRQGFKYELGVKLQGEEVKKNRYQFIKVPALIGISFVLVFLIFTKDFLDRIQVESGNQQSSQENPIESPNDNPTENPAINEDVIKWNGAIFMNKNDGSELISGELIGMKLGEITGKVLKDRDSLKDGEATEVEPGTMVYSVGRTADIAVLKGDQWIKYELVGDGVEYISEDKVLDIVKNYVQTEGISLSPTFEIEPSLHDEHLKEAPNPVWKVVAEYPLGNLDIFYIDAVTGEVLLMKENERDGFLGSNDDFVEIAEVNDHYDSTSSIYNGKFSLTVSIKANTELKNGANLLVTLVGEESSLTSEPIQITNPKEEITVPFEFDLNSEKQSKKMTGNVKLMLEIKDEIGVIIAQKIVKTINIQR